MPLNYDHHNHPPLYKKTSAGKIQHWTIRVDLCERPIGISVPVIITNWGEIDGKVQETRDVITEGKNVGKKNETTPLQQAEAEAQSQWEKKLKKGYVLTLEDALDGKTDEVIEGGVFPMLAHKFSEQGHKIVYPAYAQPKFDGHRCIAVLESGVATLWSRTRKPITGLPHIVKALEVKYPRGIVTLDGELYNHDYKDRFEELSSFIRTPEAKPGHEIVQYHVYDMVSQNLPFGARYHSYLENAFDGDVLVGVETIEVEDEDELMAAFEQFLAQGYEGLMVRNAAGLYVNKRSYDLQKVKEFEDTEFPVVAVVEGRGKLAGHAIFVCEIPTGLDERFTPGNRFNVKMKGEQEALKKYLEDPSLAVGRPLTVKFQGVTKKNGVPRFPVGERFYEAA